MTNIDKAKTKSQVDAGFIIPVHKPVGMTSFDVIRFIKKKFAFTRHMKIGHFGTLDPFAEGLLLVGIGRALRLMPFVHELCPKSYIGIGRLGVKTVTGDHTGEKVLLAANIDYEVWARNIIQTEEEILKEHAGALVGKYLQARPYFSAAKLDGIPLYKYARQGEFIDVQKIERTIYEFEVIKKYFDIQDLRILNTFYPGDLNSYPGELGQLPLIFFRTMVGTGTYVRTLFEDYCNLLGGIGHLVALFRDKIGPVAIKHGLKLQEIESCETLAQLARYALDPLKLLPLEQVWPEGAIIQKLKWGQKIAAELLPMQSATTIPYAWALVNTEEGPSIVGVLHRDDKSTRLLLHWAPDP
ncbi:MAG: hypothetical protein HYV97_16835 [Bdellovibrio sp.]|nr:hypothetical protein [Bdellovibrio sp.]